MAKKNPFVEKLEKAAKSYLSDIAGIGASPRTIENYTKRLSYFIEFYASQNPTEDPKAEDCRAWRDSLFARELKASTVRQFLCELRYFFSWCCDSELGEERIYSRNPVTKRMLPKVEKRPYDIVLSDEDVKKLWENKSPCGAATHTWARNYAIIILLLTSEIRNGELLDLTPADINFEYGELIVERGKGNKFRCIDVPEIALTAIKIYLASGLRPDYATNSDPLFGTEAEHKMRGERNSCRWHRGTTAWLSALVERHIRNVTGVSGVRSHALRHVGARLDLNSGMRAEALQAKLGHASLPTTQIYSDKLMSRRGRLSAAEVMAAREAQAEENRRLYAAMGVA